MARTAMARMAMPRTAIPRTSITRTRRHHQSLRLLLKQSEQKRKEEPLHQRQGQSAHPSWPATRRVQQP